MQLFSQTLLALFNSSPFYIKIFGKSFRNKKIFWKKMYVCFVMLC